MRLLVTRPRAEAEATARRLEALGHEAMIAPMLERALLLFQPVATTPAAIALTSTNALAGIEASPVCRQWRGVPVFCVGDRTAAAARAAGHTDVRSADGDAGDLVRLIEASLPAGAGTVFYPAATERSGHLDRALEAAGYRVELAEVYRMTPIGELPEPVRLALAAGELDGVLLYSRRTAETLIRLVDAAGLLPSIERISGFALSPTIAAGLPFARLIVAAEPNEEALLSAIGTSAAGKC